MTELNIIFAILGIGALIFYIKYRPSIDITKEGDVLLWYNDSCKREYKYLFNIYSIKK